jgi:hypothetical protein
MLDFTFIDELLRNWEPMHFKKASQPISPSSSEQSTRISCGTDVMKFNEHQTPQLVTVPSKPVKESEYPGHITNEVRQEMNEWILHHLHHLHHLFLTKEEENYFISKYGILRRQVKTAFNN